MHKEKLSAKITHMLRECIGKLLSAVLLLLIVSLIVYCIVSILPGERSHIIFGDGVGEESYALINSDVPSYVQWLGRVLRLDFGVSSFASQSVASLIAQRIPLSLTLAFFSLVFAFVFSFFITGMAVIRKKKSAVLIYETVSLVSLSLPSFVISLLLILLFSVKLGLLPSGGFVHFSQNPFSLLRIIPFLHHPCCHQVQGRQRCPDLMGDICKRVRQRLLIFCQCLRLLPEAHGHLVDLIPEDRYLSFLVTAQYQFPAAMQDSVHLAAEPPERLFIFSHLIHIDPAEEQCCCGSGQ